MCAGQVTYYFGPLFPHLQNKGAELISMWSSALRSHGLSVGWLCAWIFSHVIFVHDGGHKYEYLPSLSKYLFLFNISIHLAHNTILLLFLPYVHFFSTVSSLRKRPYFILLYMLYVPLPVRWKIYQIQLLEQILYVKLKG